MASVEDDIIQKIYISDEQPLIKLVRRVKTFLKTLENPNSSEISIDELYQSLLIEIKQYEFNISRVNVIIDTNERERNHYKTLVTQTDTEGQISQLKNEIEQLKAELVIEKKMRRHKEEYEVLHQVISQYPSRQQSQEQIQQLQLELQTLSGKKNQTEYILQQRSRQFSLLFHSIELLKQEMDPSLSISPSPSNLTSKNDNNTVDSMEVE